MSGYDEAVAWFRADPERVRDLDDVDNRSTAIAIVNAVLAGAVPAGRDLTAQDVRDALGEWDAFLHRDYAEGVAAGLNRIARGAPERGDGEPRRITDDEFVRCPECGSAVRGWVLRRADESRKANQNLPADPDHPAVANMIEAQAMGACDLCGLIPTAGSLPAAPSEVREALAYYREYPHALDMESHYSATVTQWVLSLPDEHRDWAQATAGGSRRSCVCGDRRDNDGVTHRTGGPCFQSPRSWSLPAPPPDDVTVVHVDDMRFEREGARWLDADGHWHPWARLVTGGTVVEGEPPAPEPEYAVSNWVRVPTTDGDTVTVGAPALDRRPHPESRWDTRTETWEPAPEPQAAEPLFAVGDRVRVRSDADCYADMPGSVANVDRVLVQLDEGSGAWIPRSDLEPAPEPPRFKRGFYRLARDLVHTDGAYLISGGMTLALMGGSDGEWVVMVPHGATAVVTAAALAAAGAVRVEGEQA